MKPPHLLHCRLEHPAGDQQDARSVHQWLLAVCRSLENSSLPLGRYYRSTSIFVDTALAALGKSNEIFPCPPPYPWPCETQCLPGRSRKRCRWNRRRAIELWVNLMVCALSSEALQVEVAPLRGRRGCSLNRAQHDMVSFLKTLASSVVCLGSKDPSCGLRLPSTARGLEQLRERLSSFEELPYASRSRAFGVNKRAGVFTQPLPVVAERLSLPEKVSDFDPRPYLSETFRRIYEDPNEFLKTPEEMPEAIKIKGTATRKELLKVFARWDGLGRLFICKGSEVSQEDRCELFAVSKDQEKDRQILHRKRRNRREVHVTGASKDLPHGVLLCQLPLEEDRVCVCSVDDVKDFYHAYSASEARARSSPVGPLFRASEVQHLEAYRVALSSGRISEGDSIACCFRGLGMGDHAAVDIAQESHVNLLKAFGAMREAEVLKYRLPVPNPTSGFYEGIMIDDHLGVQLLRRRRTLAETLKQPGRDQEVFGSAQTAYRHAGLEPHPKKQVRRSLHARVWGAELEGDRGLVGPTRGRLLALACLSAAASEAGPIDEKTLEGILGLWGYCTQYRRPLLSFIYELYRETPPGAAEEPFLLSRGARNELLLLSCLVPLCISDLRAILDSWVYCVDASPSGAGVCRARVNRFVSRELWRRGDKLGFRCPLLSSLSAALKGSGWGEEEAENWLDTESLCSEGADGVEEPCSASFGEDFLSLARARGWRPPEGLPLSVSDPVFDFLELYAGGKQMSASWTQQGFSVLPPVELKDGWDLRDQDLFFGLMRLVARGGVRFVWSAPPSTTFSLARSPKLRSLTCPWGYHLLDADTLIGNLHVGQTFLLVLLQMAVGHAFVVEQPAFGSMRVLSPWKVALERGAFEVRFDWCRFDKPHRKPTKLLSNVLCLTKLGKCCHHSFKHESLIGTAIPQTGYYSKKFCDLSQLCANRPGGTMAVGLVSHRGLVSAERGLRTTKWVGSFGVVWGSLRLNHFSDAVLVRAGKEVPRCGLCSCLKACRGKRSCSTSSVSCSTLICRRLRLEGLW